MWPENTEESKNSRARWKGSAARQFFWKAQRITPRNFLPKRAIPGGLPAPGSCRSRRLIAPSQRFSPAAEFTHAVDRLVLRFVVSPRQHFADQAGRNKLNAAHHQRHPQQHERPVISQQPFVQQRLAKENPESDSRSTGQAGQSQQSKELQRLRRIIQQELNAQQIQQHPDGPRNPVIGFATLASDIRDGYFCDRRPRPASQCRNKAVQLSVQMNLRQNFAPVSFKRRAKVVQIYARELRHHPVGDPAWKLPRQPMIRTRNAPSADQVVAFFNFFQESRDLIGVMLQIAVHGNNDLSASEIKARLQRWRLPKISP